MRALILSFLLVLAPLSAVRADEPTATTSDLAPQSPGAHLDEAVDHILAMLRLVVSAIPQYELPEVLPNGDIIIRRVHPPMEDPGAEDDGGAENPAPENKPRQRPDEPPGEEPGVRT